MLDIGLAAGEDASKVAKHREQVAAIEADPTLKTGRRASELKRLAAAADRTWITNHSYWWGANGAKLVDITLVREVDIAVGRLEPPPAATTYPTIKNPSGSLLQGRSLCRLGFPFHEIAATYDAATTSFNMDQQFTYFPIEGIYTRTIDSGTTTDGRFPIKFIETSSPGLMGQSGGPLFDLEGRVWGIQSRTQHIALGFHSKATFQGRQTDWPQFINLGLAVHPETITTVLSSLGVAFDMSAD